MPSVLQKFASNFLCRYDTYGDSCVVGIFSDREDRALLNYNFMAIVDCLSAIEASPTLPSYEGVITAVPAAVSTADAAVYLWDVNTAAGDIDFTGLGAIAGVDNGNTVVFYNLGTNSIVYTYKGYDHVIPPEDVLHLIWDSSEAAYHKVV